MKLRTFSYALFVLPLLLSCRHAPQNQPADTGFRVLAFHSAKTEDAHMSFIHEANRWFAEKSREYGFTYDSTSDWNKLVADDLSNYQVLIFLDVRPDSADQRAAFQRYMENGGAWIGFHFAGFALTPSAYPQDWNWYHNKFLGSGEYKGNTWKPTPAFLKVEDPDHPVTRDLQSVFLASANEWYSWQNDLRTNPDIKILLSVDSTSFPLGTGPKPHEIWHSGYYPVVWTNTNFRMLYINMGHNDLDYDSGTNKELSYTFGNAMQDKLILDGLMWLGRGER